MTFRFPILPQEINPTETPVNYLYDHLIVCGRKGKAPGKLWYPTAVAIDPANDCIYLTEGIGFLSRLSVFCESGEYLSGYTHKLMRRLWGIAILGDNLYVTDIDMHSVFLLNLDGGIHLVDWLGCRGSRIGQFDSPRQLSIGTNGDLYIADQNNHRIQILDSFLHPIREVIHPSMHRPCDVKLTTEEIYVLSDSDSPCLHVFSYPGSKIRSIITCSEGMPSFFCLDACRNLIISDFDTGQIEIFSNEGTHLHTLKGEGHGDGMFVHQTGLALTSKLKLVTLLWNVKYQLQIFLPN